MYVMCIILHVHVIRNKQLLFFSDLKKAVPWYICVHVLHIHMWPHIYVAIDLTTHMYTCSNVDNICRRRRRLHMHAYCCQLYAYRFYSCVQYLVYYTWYILYIMYIHTYMYIHYMLHMYYMYSMYVCVYTVATFGTHVFTNFFYTYITYKYNIHV